MLIQPEAIYHAREALRDRIVRLREEGKKEDKMLPAMQLRWRILNDKTAIKALDEILKENDLPVPDLFPEEIVGPPIDSTFVPEAESSE